MCKLMLTSYKNSSAAQINMYINMHYYLSYTNLFISIPHKYCIVGAVPKQGRQPMV